MDSLIAYISIAIILVIAELVYFRPCRQIYLLHKVICIEIISAEISAISVQLLVCVSVYFGKRIFVTGF